MHRCQTKPKHTSMNPVTADSNVNKTSSVHICCVQYVYNMCICSTINMCALSIQLMTTRCCSGVFSGVFALESMWYYKDEPRPGWASKQWCSWMVVNATTNTRQDEHILNKFHSTIRPGAHPDQVHIPTRCTSWPDVNSSAMFHLGHMQSIQN